MMTKPVYSAHVRGKTPVPLSYGAVTGNLKQMHNKEFNDPPSDCSWTFFFLLFPFCLPTTYKGRASMCPATMDKQLLRLNMQFTFVLTHIFHEITI